MQPHNFDLTTYLEAQALDYLYLMEDMDIPSHKMVEEYTEYVPPRVVSDDDTLREGEGSLCP